MESTDNQQHDKLMEVVSREAYDTRMWDIALGCGMAVVLLIDHNVFTRYALIVFLLIQIVRYKGQVCDNVFMVTYRITSMDDKVDYMQASQFSRVSLKLSTYLILTAVYFCMYVVTANPYAWLFVRWSVVLATILM
jgi:hypothetical protein